MNRIAHVVSMSTGKDSTAAALVAIETVDPASIVCVMADTGNEHQLVYDHFEYLKEKLPVRFKLLKADFSQEFVVKRRNLARIAAGEPETAVYGSREFMYAWTPEAATKALELLHPTGIPYLDLCLVRGGFPSRTRQFCTEYLKTRPLTEYAMELIDGGLAVWSWQGVRAEESPRRAFAKSFEEVGGGLYINRPILRWKAADTFEAMRYWGVEPNPLYKLGMSRVGCMPCINCRKEDLREIALRFPEHIDRIAKWEELVSKVCRPRSPVSFFHLGTHGLEGQASVVREVVRWSRTTRGGRQFDLLIPSDPPTCSSAYGLCDGL